MCGINVIKLLNNTIEKINRHSAMRGPDLTNIIKVNEITFIHNLLHITGDITPQPFQDEENNIVCLYNGEIYNYKSFNNEYTSDGQCLIPLYLKYGKNFIKYLDGEFAIVLFDFKNEIFILSTDVFSTKPLFYSFEGDNFMISSYSTCIKANKMKNIIKVPANTTYVIDIHTLKIIDNLKVYKFDLVQSKSTYEDWCYEFDRAIQKRSETKQNIFVSLSSGYDSGLICSSLNNIGKTYKTYSVLGRENENILKNRIVINNQKYNLYRLDPSVDNKYISYINSNCSNFISKVRKHTNKIYNVQRDRASIGGAFVYEKAKKDGYLIGLSGQGADEIISDYGFDGTKIMWHSCFGGKFPTDLTTIFPWESFYTGIGECLLMKEEIIGGSYGLEIRYPFLDKNLVQEFLLLHPDLKNKAYKAPIKYYFDKTKYPYIPEKIGFNCLY